MSALPARPIVPTLPRVLTQGAAMLAIALLIAYAAIAIAAIAQNWYYFDARGYWDTGLSLRNGDELYPPVVDQDDPFVYRYAPWFAWLWVALTFLPQGLVFAGWGVALTAASAWLLWQLPRNATGLVLALIFGPMLLRVVSQGNVQPLMVAALTWGLMRASGPLWVALGASLKIVPIVFAALYLVRREYARAAISLALTVVLWLPAVAYGLSDYPTSVGGEAFPFGWFTFLIAAAALAAVFVAPSRYRPLAAGLAVTFASPRWIPYNPTYLMVGLPHNTDDADQSP
jgi:hypothetical protein